LDDVVFHCQQAAEKALKGFFVEQYPLHPFAKLTALKRLANNAWIWTQLFGTLWTGRCLSLNTLGSFGIREDPEEPSLEEAEEALVIARELYDAIITRLPQECGLFIPSNP
jgi:hypothetical protein